MYLFINIEVLLTHDVTLVSGVWHSDSTRMCTLRRAYRGVTTVCHHAVLLQYHWLYSPCCVFYPWGIAVFNLRLSRSCAVNPTMFCRRKILGSINELFISGEFPNGRTLSVLGLASRVICQPWHHRLGCGIRRWSAWEGIRLGWLGLTPRAYLRGLRGGLSTLVR